VTTRRSWFFLSLAGLPGCRPGARRLNVLNWSNYIAPSTLEGFRTETGIEVRYAIYESNEEMLARVMSGNSDWDVVFPSHYFVGPMREMKLLAPLSRSWFRGERNLEDRFRHPQWDPNLEWCVPYMWGSSGILYNPRLAQPEPSSWADLWSDRYRGRTTMLDDPAEVFGAALQMLGLPLNESSEAGLRRAFEAARRQKPLLRAYLNTEVRDQIVAGDLAVCHAWATTAQQAIDAAPHLKFVFAREGFSLYADCAVILRESRRGAEARAFIDYLLRADVAAEVVRSCRTSTANAAARALLPPSLSRLQTLFPAPETLARGEWFETLPPAAQRLRDRLWTELKSG
jgi:spermidine/putrescine-binding protein